MSSPILPSPPLDGRVPAGGRAFLWLLGCLATAVGLFGLAGLMAAENEREAGRWVIAAQQGAGYLATVTAAYAARHGQPHRP